MDDKDYYQSVLAKINPQSKYVSPYDTSEAPVHPNMSVGTPALAPTVQSNMPPIDPVKQAPAGVVASARGSRTYGPGPANEQSLYYVKPPELNPVTALNNQNEQTAVLSGQRDKHVAAQADAMTDLAMAQQKGAQDTADIYTDHADNLAASAEQADKAQALYQQDADKLAKEKQSIAQEMSDFYQRQPTDLWGRAGVNKVSGIIGLFMGALSRDGHNPAMDALNTLVDQNLSQQKFNYEMLGNKAKMNDSLYGRLRDKLGDEKSAELLSRQVMNEEMLSRLKATEANTVSKTGKANLASAIADLQMKNDDYKQQALDHSFDQVTKAANLGLIARGQDLQYAQSVLSVNASKQGQEGLPGEINGFTAPENAGLRLSKAATDKSREEQQGVREVHEVVQDIKEKIASGGLTSDLEKNQAEAALKLAIVKAHNLSRRVGGDEGKLIEQDAGRLSLGLTGWITNKVDPRTVTRLMDSLDRSTERAYVKGLVTNGYTVTPGGMYDHANDATTETPSGNPLQKYETRGGTKKQALPTFNE